MKLVSIVIPTYNRLAMLKEAVDSCQRQTYENIEIIVSDDGSTDGTLQWLEVLSVGSSRVRFVARNQAEKRGACGARNRGLNAANGDYIQFLDSDDLLLPEKIALQLSAIESTAGMADLAVCWGRMGHVDVQWDELQKIGQAIPSASRLLDFLCSKVTHVLQTNAPLWRRSFIDRVGTWNEKLSASQDWEFNVRLLCADPAIVTIEKDLFWVRQHQGEQISRSSHNSEHWRAKIIAFESAVSCLSAQGYLSAQRRISLLGLFRSCYIAMLPFAVESDIRKCEKLIIDLNLSWRTQLYRLVFLVRRIFGNSLLVSLYRVSRLIKG